MPEVRDLPLFRWGEELRRLRRARQNRLRLQLKAGAAAAGIALISFTIIAPPLPRLVWNLSASAPLGLYAVSPGAKSKVGDMVVAWTPGAIRQLAAQRRYIPANVPLVKRVAAGRDDLVCARDAAVKVNGRRVADRRRNDRAGRPMPWWRGCRLLGQDEYFLLMGDVPGSFDGRYFGPVSSRDIIGKAIPLWVR